MTFFSTCTVGSSVLDGVISIGGGAVIPVGLFGLTMATDLACGIISGALATPEPAGSEYPIPRERYWSLAIIGTMESAGATIRRNTSTSTTATAAIAIPLVALTILSWFIGQGIKS